MCNTNLFTDKFAQFFNLPASYFIRKHIRMFALTSRYIGVGLLINERVYEYTRLDKHVLDSVIKHNNRTCSNSNSTNACVFGVDTANMNAINKFKCRYKYNTYNNLVEDNDDKVNDRWYTNNDRVELHPQQVLDIYVRRCNTYAYNGGIWPIVYIYKPRAPILCAQCVYYSLLCTYDIYKMFLKYCECDTGSNRNLESRRDEVTSGIESLVFTSFTACDICFEEFENMFMNAVNDSDNKYAYPLLQHLQQIDCLYIMSIVYNTEIHEFVYIRCE